MISLTDGRRSPSISDVLTSRTDVTNPRRLTVKDVCSRTCVVVVGCEVYRDRVITGLDDVQRNTGFVGSHQSELILIVHESVGRSCLQSVLDRTPAPTAFNGVPTGSVLSVEFGVCELDHAIGNRRRCRAAKR